VGVKSIGVLASNVIGVLFWNSQKGFCSIMGVSTSFNVGVLFSKTSFIPADTS